MIWDKVALDYCAQIDSKYKNEMGYCRTQKPTIATRSRQIIAYEFLVSKKTVVLRRWEGSKQKFGFIKRVDKG